ncbi:thermonuclease family protein [Mycoplasma corogypsi]|uniref:thermonuclease family protein n=1 Tax=Mycoplasma corogypsi TaxID=2106 RepID=UPI003873AB82
MKFNKKLLTSTMLFSSSILTPIVFASCTDTNTDKNTSTTESLNPQNPNYLKDAVSGYKLNIRKTNSGAFARLSLANDGQSTTLSTEKTKEFIAKIQPSIDKLQAKAKVLADQAKQLTPSDMYFTVADPSANDSLSVKLNDNEYIVFTPSENPVSVSLDLGKYGEAGVTNLNFATKNTVTNSIQFNYDIKSVVKNGDKWDEYNIELRGFGSNLPFTFKKDITFSPVLEGQLNHFVLDTSVFKPVTINWDKLSSAWADIKITNTSDGDTFQFEVMNAPEKYRTHFDTGTNQPKIRLAGIDTPEKFIGNQAAPFEYAFALLSTEFGKAVFKKYPTARIAFADSKDAFGRFTADIFFGDNYQYSYNTEIVRAGYTYPYSFSDDPGLIQKDLEGDDSYIKLVYPSIAQAFNEAITNRKGFFKWINNVPQGAKDIYRKKPNQKWLIFWDKSKVYAFGKK